MEVDVGFLKWKDPLAWTEKRSAATSAAFKKESRLFKKELLDKFTQEDIQNQTTKFMVAAYEHSNIREVHREILVKPILEGTGGYEWCWKGDTRWVSTANLDIGKVADVPYVAYVLDIGTSKNDYFLTVHSQKRWIWTHRRGCGSDIAILGNRVYCVESVSPLRYTRLVSFDLKTGKGRQVLYEESDPSVQLALLRVEGGVFFRTDNAGHERLWSIGSKGLERVSPEGICFFPVGPGAYFVRIGGMDADWTLQGLNWELNSEILQQGIEYCSLKHRLLVTKFFGLRNFWKFGRGGKPKKLCQILACIIPNHWTEDDDLWLTVPGMTVVKATTDMVLSRPLVQYGQLQHGVSQSADGLPVRWALVQGMAAPPKGLMLVAYGAYGTHLTLSTTRWRPWIETGWSVGLLFIRGGGDGNEMWADLGRRGGKLGSIEDVEACCRDLQRLTGCGPKRTCLFGRSAGGLIVGNITARHPRGQLVGTIYAEAPYVDVLKTASNPALPLTEYEYDEFANPRKSPVRFQQALQLSPVHALGPDGAPGVNVLCRGGREDIQVYPYEPLKWIMTLRGKRRGTDNKLLSVGNDAHFSSRELVYGERAADYLIINSWMFLDQ